MYQFYIVETQKYFDGSYGDIRHIAYDEDYEKARLKAESKYYEVLSAAAISALPAHGAILFDSDCNPIMHYCYHHPVAPPEPEPEPEPEPSEE